MTQHDSCRPSRPRLILAAVLAAGLLAPAGALANPLYKVFEARNPDDAKDEREPKLGNTYTRLGIRDSDVEAKGKFIPGINPHTRKPQGMSLLNTVETAVNSVEALNRPLCVFGINTGDFPGELQVRRDPDDSTHYLVGTADGATLKLGTLNSKLQSTQDDWDAKRCWDD